MATNQYANDVRSNPHVPSDEFLDDIKAATNKNHFSPSVDYRAIAVQAVEDYWTQRDIGLIDRQGQPTDETSMLHRMAIRRLTSPLAEYLTDLGVTIVPPLFVFAMLFCPFLVNGKSFLFAGRYIPLSAFIVVLFATLIAITFLIKILKAAKGEDTRGYHIAGSFVGGLIAVAMVLGLSGYGIQQQVANQRASQEFAITSNALVRDRMLHVSRVTFERSLSTGNLEKAALTTTSIELPNKKRLTVSAERVSPQKIVYRGRTEGIPGSVIATLEKSSGSITEETVDGAPVSIHFYIGTVLSVSNDAVTVRMLDDQKKEVTMMLSLDTLVFPPLKGDTVFVVTDPESNKATDIIGL